MNKNVSERVLESLKCQYQIAKEMGYHKNA